jgi:hypothetical protein
MPKDGWKDGHCSRGRARHDDRPLHRVPKASGEDLAQISGPALDLTYVLASFVA